MRARRSGFPPARPRLQRLITADSTVTYADSSPGRTTACARYAPGRTRRPCRRSSSLPATARAVQILLRASGARRVLEIGTLAGYSAVWIARGLPPDGSLLTLEIDPDRAAVARRSLEVAGVADRVEVRVGDALDLMAALDPDPPFDAVFLDADKERYCEYLGQAARLVRRGGLLMADNAFWRGGVLDPAGSGELAAHIHRFNESVAADPRFEATILPVGDGLMVAVRK